MRPVAAGRAESEGTKTQNWMICIRSASTGGRLKQQIFGREWFTARLLRYVSGLLAARRDLGVRLGWVSVELLGPGLAQFPGSGWAVRCPDDITHTRVSELQSQSRTLTPSPKPHSGGHLA
jgi:hypothetical protein